MPSRRHELLATVVPRLRKARELETPEAERARLERWHAALDRGFPTGVVPLYGRRYAVVREELSAGAGGQGIKDISCGQLGVRESELESCIPGGVP